jgi:NTE family protein
MQMKVLIRICSIAAILIAMAGPAFAQGTPPADRPSVGLVLSGGGARGFAHIGVIRVLEQNRVPVDYVAGASMGALVGAMYALGYSPDEMERLVSTLSWDELLKPGAPYDELSFRRREDRRNIASPVILKGKVNSLKLPNALNSGHEIGLLFDKITLPYAEVRDFDRFPIPFRCVATDMVRGESVVLDSGSLSSSLRATMAIPGIFAPIEIDGRILADGGLVNNIPTNVAKAMGADIVLVINIETQLSGRDSLDSLPGVLAQALNVATVDNSRRSLQQADLIIAPDLAEYSTGDFSKYQEIIRLGFEGARAKAAILKGLSLDDTAWQQHIASRQARETLKKTTVPEFVAIDTDNENAVETIRAKLGDKYAGKPLDAERHDQLADDLTQLTGSGRFDSLNYEITERDGRPGILIRTNSRENLANEPSRLEIGVDVNSIETDNVNFNFRARLTSFDVWGYRSEWRNDLVLGSNSRASTELYKPLGKSNFFVAPRVAYERDRIDIFSAGDRIAEYVEQQAQLGVDFGYAVNSRSEVRVGYVFGYQHASRRVGDPVLPDVNGFFNAFRAGWTYDGVDNAQVPTRGLYTKNTLHYYFDTPGAERGLGQFESRNFGFRQLGGRSILFGFGGAGTSFGETAPALEQFTLGGAFRLGGYDFGEFRASNYLQAGGGILYNPEIFPSFLGGKVYVGGWYEGGSAFERIGNSNYRQSFSGGVIFETPLGPFFAGSSVNENGGGRIYFSFGRVFK